MEGCTIRLTDISDIPGGLEFAFDDGGLKRVWRFHPSSRAEFLALILRGAFSQSGRLMLEPLDIQVAPNNGDGVEITATIGGVDLACRLDSPGARQLSAGIAEALHAD